MRCYASLRNIRELAGSEPATTDTYLRSLSSSISYVAQFIEEDVLPKSKTPESHWENKNHGEPGISGSPPV